MDQTVSKLLSMFEEGVKALGTQAGRLYPEVVKLYMWEHILAAVFSLIGFVLVFCSYSSHGRFRTTSQ
jgi:hypothetical protein